MVVRNSGLNCFHFYHTPLSLNHNRNFVTERSGSVMAAENTPDPEKAQANNIAKLGEYKLVRTVGEGTFGKVKRESRIFPADRSSQRG